MGQQPTMPVTDQSHHSELQYWTMLDIKAYFVDDIRMLTEREDYKMMMDWLMLDMSAG